MIIWFLLQSLLTLISFIILIASSDYSGGYVGMTPLTVLLAVSIQFVSSIVLYFAIRNLIKANRNYVFFILNMILYELSYVVFSEGAPVLDFFNSGFEGFINRSYTLSSLMASACVMIVFLLFRQKNSKAAL